MATCAFVSGAAPGSAAAPAEVGDLYFQPQARTLAACFADRFRLVECDAPPRETDGFHLWAANDRLELRQGRGGRVAALWIGLEEVRRRAQQGSELRKACGEPGAGGKLLDPMGGWGIDALVLAGRGWQVEVVERHPAVSALQQDLVRRSGAVGVHCRCADGFEVLTASTGVDVVYLDPMFPERRKRALPGRRMQWLAQLARQDARPLAQWLELARAASRGRVVLKRRRTDPQVSAPDWQIVGRTVRYDVYRGAAGRSSPSS